MGGEVIFGSLGGLPIVSAATTISEFARRRQDYSAFYGRANSYTCPVGAEPGMAYVLMRQDRLKELDTSKPLTLLLGVGDSRIWLGRLAFLQAQRVMPVATDDPDGLYVVTLADARWLLKRTFINKRYNLRKYCTADDWIDGTLKTPGNPWTFAEICEDIWGHFPVTSTSEFFFDLPWSSDYIVGPLPTDVPENIRFEGVSALEALEELCQQFGYFLRYDPQNGTLAILKIGFSPEQFPAADGWMQEGFGISKTSILTGVIPRFLKMLGVTRRWIGDNLIEDTEMFHGQPLLPKSVRVVFPNNGVGCGNLEIVNSSTGRGWTYSVTVTAADVRGTTLTSDQYSALDTLVLESEVILNSTTFAAYSSAASVTPDNLSELESIASRIATDYYTTAILHAASRVVYREIKEVIPGPHITEVRWREIGDGLKTDVSKRPLAVGNIKLSKLFDEGSTSGGGGGDGACNCCNPSNCSDYPIPFEDCDACRSGPRQWTVDFGDMDSELCPNYSSAVTLDRSAYCVYESDFFMCSSLAAISGCAGADECCDGKSTTWTKTDGVYVVTENTCDGDCAENFTPAPGAASNGTTVTRPCVGGGGETGRRVWTSSNGTTWVLTGESGSCEETPSAPTEYPPSGTGDLITISCCDASGLEGEQYSQFVLSISSERDDENRNRTTLKLMVGDAAAITYQMPIGKDWCCTCENKLELKCCGPYSFVQVPESVCVVPKDFNADDLYVTPDGGWNTGCCTLTNGGKVPRYFLLDAVIADSGFPFAKPCCGTASGAFALEYQYGATWSYYFNPGTINEQCIGDCDDNATGTGFSTMSEWRMYCTGVQWILALYVYECNTGGAGTDCPDECNSVAQGRVVMQWNSVSGSHTGDNCDDSGGIPFARVQENECTGPYNITVRPITDV